MLQDVECHYLIKKITLQAHSAKTGGWQLSVKRRWVADVRDNIGMPSAIAVEI
jgi:hypothetical protein